LAGVMGTDEESGPVVYEVTVAVARVGIMRGWRTEVWTGEGDRPFLRLGPRGPTGDLGPLSLGESGASVRTGEGVLLRIRSGAVGTETGDPHRTEC